MAFNDDLWPLSCLDRLETFDIHRPRLKKLAAPHDTAPDVQSGEDNSHMRFLLFDVVGVIVMLR